jgi:glycosyltransferase involved in cell wall biosynthesis
MRRSVAVNTRLLIKNRLEGIGWFGHETLSRITTAHPEVDFHFFFDRPFDQQFIYGSNVTGHVIFPQARHPFLYYLWFEWSVKSKLDELKPDLFLSIDGLLSLRSSVPQISVIHDINFEHYPDYLPLLTRWYHLHYFKKFAQKANQIVTVSEFSKTDIQKQYGIEAEKINVIYNGASPLFKPVSADTKKHTQEKYSQGTPYLIYVGALQPRKNIGRLLHAFDAYKKESNSNVKLLLTGEKKWWSPEQEQLFSSLAYKEDVAFTGRLDQAELATVMASAEGLTYVSVFEGFGIPILEAMKCEIPVLTSNVSSMPEVGGKAAVYCDPWNVESITLGIHDLLDASKRGERIEKGRMQREKFSWDKTAEALWKSMERVMDRG